MELHKNNKQKITDKSKKTEEFIIAIGASSGGMEAIHTLFDNTSNDAVSYVIIQHLSPDHKSFMAELLAKHSMLKIFVAEDGMEVVSNCVYVMPEGKTMTIMNGKLMLKPRQGSSPNSAVDIFFNALAQDQRNKSIGIVLSGNGADGTKGIAAIKKVGGMVIVQDPDTTEYNSMPKSAIESGYYDYILSPQLIPQQIIDYVNQNTMSNIFSDPVSGKDEVALTEVINLIKDHTPLDFSEYKRPTIIRRIIRRVIANNLESVPNYIQFLKSNPSEIEILSKQFLISVTKFFRDPEAFEIIRNKVIPEIVENKLLVDTLKIWVIGCATGEEAYSMAILVKEYLTETKKDIEVKIFASDIDTDALTKASKGCYPESIKEVVSESRLQNFFVKEGKEYKVKDNIRKMIIFATHDIVHHPPYGKIDLISCRNLLIYLNPTLQKRIFSTLHFCLNIGGYLFLGPSEAISNPKGVFLEVDEKWKIYQNTERTYRLGMGAYSPQHLEIRQYSHSSISSKPQKIQAPENIFEIIAQSHLEESGFLAGVCIDEKNEIIMPFGKFETFLRPKLFTSNLLDLLPSELAIAVSTAIKQTVRTNTKVSINSISYKENDTILNVSILVKYCVSQDKSFQNVHLIYFREETSNSVSDEIVELFAVDVHTKKHLLDTEKELVETKKKLKEAYLALEASNDNIQSYNEELLSGNEEMQSSNEELQSINEELNTMNDEYQLKIKELAELNDDFNNYFKSTINSQLFVDKDLIIKKFTPVAIKEINLKENDIGRRLTDIFTTIKFSNLAEDILQVIDTKISNAKQVETTDGKWYAMLILPYVRSEEGTTDGAIITFNDITDIKKSKQLIEATNKKLIRINEDHNSFIYSVSHDLKAPLYNIEGLVAELKGSEDPEDIKSLADMVNQSIAKLKDTINELSDLASIEKEAEDAGLVDLMEIIEDVKWSLRDKIKQSKAKFNINLEEKEIKFSKKNLRSILLNLISNAVKYRSDEREPEIAIDTRKREDCIVLRVQDNGLGIAKEKINTLFSKYSRVHDLSSNVEGSGIGLFLVKKLLANAGDEIKVESKLGKGSCFKVYFRI